MKTFYSYCFFLLQKPTHPTYNICIDSAYDALEYFKNKALDSTDEELKDPKEDATSGQCSYTWKS